MDTCVNRRSLIGWYQNDAYSMQFSQGQAIRPMGCTLVIGIGYKWTAVGTVWIHIRFTRCGLVVDVNVLELADEVRKLRSTKNMVESHIDISLTSRTI